MNIQVWAAFVLAAAIVLAIPGPTILLVISQAISHGRKAVMPLVAGQLRDRLQNSTVHRWLNRCGGSVLNCAGLATGPLKRSS